MIEASTQFMIGRLSTESGKCNSFNLDGIFGNDSLTRAALVALSIPVTTVGPALPSASFPRITSHGNS